MKYKYEYHNKASLNRILFHSLSKKHKIKWGKEPTITDAFIDTFHGQGHVLVVNLGPNKRVSLKEGFTVHVSHPVNDNPIHAVLWKKKNGKRERLKWIKNGEQIPGRVNTKMKVEITGKHSICVKPSLTGVMYGFKNDEEYGPFSRGIYITTNSVLEFIGTNGTVYSVPIRKNKRSSETVNKSIKVLGITIQSSNISKYKRQSNSDLNDGAELLLSLSE